jgi:DNA-binding transcriptional regulator/RsmH inhibitor MraZ
MTLPERLRRYANLTEAALGVGRPEMAQLFNDMMFDLRKAANYIEHMEQHNARHLLEIKKREEGK